MSSRQRYLEYHFARTQPLQVNPTFFDPFKIYRDETPFSTETHSIAESVVATGHHKSVVERLCSSLLCSLRVLQKTSETVDVSPRQHSGF